ncbi:MAG: hydroxymethylbilane synthase [Candidatus Eremiobacteraeota bacterium]|nr:hydroxymethylbilane synthase [Candidatus Eremiobacteraeota bacterium]
MLSISLRPNGRRAVIVGGGDVAARKAESLADAGFPVFVVAERIGERLRSLVSDRRAVCAERRYDVRDVEGAVLVIAATNDVELNARILLDARAVHALVCDATDSGRGDFTMAATQRVGDLTISVDSAGAAPAFSRRVVREIAEGLGEPYADAVRSLARMRAYVKDAFAPPLRGRILRRLAERPISELVAMPRPAICATRRSDLAMIQSATVAARLAERGVATTMLGVTTAGDRDRATPIDLLGAANVFVKELEQALRDRRADFAVHSCKDLAGSLAGDMELVAISSREDPRDAYCSERYATFESLPPGAVVGTSSVRRRAQLQALRPDLRYEPLRGNVDTRLSKLAGGNYDAIVLAMAGLKRLGAGATYVVPFTIEQLVPAVAQGALAIEMRAGDDPLRPLIRDAINDVESEICVTCERAALRAMRAGCSAPLGVYARREHHEIVVEAIFIPEPHAATRARIARPIATLEEARALGTDIAERLKAAVPVAAQVVP